MEGHRDDINLLARINSRGIMREGMIRPIAICVCRNGDRILVAEGHDSKKGQTFYRPLGGTIEFGECGDETVRREFREEISTDLSEMRYLGLLENIFTYEGRRGHEIVLVYNGQLSDARLYEKETFQANEQGHPFKAVWKWLDEFGPGKLPVYPDGLLELLGYGRDQPQSPKVGDDERNAGQEFTRRRNVSLTEEIMREEKIRPIAICVCRDGDRILVAEYLEKGRLYYRPLGGGIEFGERGEETAQREIREEIDSDLSEVCYLGMLENIYVAERVCAHQIVLVYDGSLSDARLYEKETILGNELGEPFKAVWKRLDEFGSGKPPVYPDGLLALLGA